MVKRIFEFAEQQRPATLLTKFVLPRRRKFTLPKRRKYILPNKRMFKSRPSFKWGGVFELWARNYVGRHYWRVRHVFASKEDALQECALVFTECLNKYEYRVDKPQWMMALFKTSVVRMWHTAATKDTKNRVEFAYEDTTLLDKRVDFNHGPLVVALSEHGQDLKELAEVLLTAPAEFLMLIFRGDAEDGTVDTADVTRRVKRLFGMSIGARDLFAELRGILSKEA